jgi:hypothetical protein
MENLSPEQIYDYVLKYVEKRLGTNGVTMAGQLDDVCKSAFKSEWAGVYPADKLPTLNATQCKCIYNADRHDQPGSHWMSLYYDKNSGKTYSYDSYGRNLKTDKVYKNVKKSKRVKLKQSQEFDPEQTDKESNCGQRCISWLALAGQIPIEDLMRI